MISRNNSDIFSEDSFNKIASIVKKADNRKLYKTCSTKEELVESAKKIKLAGYNYEIENAGNDKCNIYSIFPKDAIDLNDANKSGQFRKLAWGRYSFQKVSAIGDFQKYDFDDGTIWRVITSADGKQYLAKEVTDDEEEKVLRKKVAFLKKKATLNVSNDNASNICDMLFSTKDDFFTTIMQSDSSQVVINFLKAQFDEYINNLLSQNGITDQQQIQNAKQVIYDKINKGSVLNADSIQQLVTTLGN